MAQIGSLSAETETLSQVLSLVEAFRAFDSNNDGLIDMAELGALLASLGFNPSEQEVRSVMQEADKNRDGLMSIYEFLEMNLKETEVGNMATFLRAAFEALDFHGDEPVIAEELYEVMRNMGVDFSLEDCKNIVASLNGNRGATGSFEDFGFM